MLSNDNNKEHLWFPRITVGGRLSSSCGAASQDERISRRLALLGSVTLLSLKTVSVERGEPGRARAGFIVESCGDVPAAAKTMRKWKAVACLWSGRSEGQTGRVRAPVTSQPARAAALPPRSASSPSLPACCWGLGRRAVKPQRSWQLASLVLGWSVCREGEKFCLITGSLLQPLVPL